VVPQVGGCWGGVEISLEYEHDTSVQCLS